MSEAASETRMMSRFSSGDFDGAAEEAGLLLRERPGHEAALNVRAKVRALKSDWEGVVSDMAAIVAANPSARLGGVLGNAYYHVGDANAARAEYDREIELDPENANLYFFRARLRKESGNMEGARRDYETSAIKDPRADRWMELAILEAEAGEHESALRRLDEAVKLSPDWGTVLNRGVLRSKLRRWEDAIADLDRVFAEIGGKPAYARALQQVHHSRGYCKFFLKRDDALDDLNEAIRLDPHDARALCLRGAIFSVHGDARGLRDLDESIRLEPEAWTFRFRADLRLKLGDKTGARDDYRRAAELDPSMAEAVNAKLGEEHGG